MNLLSILAMAAPSAQGGEAAGNPIGMFLPIILIFVIMYLLILRPQAKKQKEHQQMVNSLEKGSKVVTAGGIHGTVVGVKKDTNIVVVKIDENVKIEVNRGSIASVISAEPKK